jgi:hypothetical protein
MSEALEDFVYVTGHRNVDITGGIIPVKIKANVMIALPIHVELEVVFE